MMDDLYYRNKEKLGKGERKVLAALMACLEALLDFMEKHRPQYFNTGQKVPECIRVRKELELKVVEVSEGVALPEDCTYGQLRDWGKDAAGTASAAVESVCPDCLKWLLDEYPDGQSVEEVHERRKYAWPTLSCTCP